MKLIILLLIGLGDDGPGSTTAVELMDDDGVTALMGDDGTTYLTAD